MKVFVNTNIDPQGGFYEANISFEESLKRFESASTLYAMSCGSPVPNNNDQELFETAWLLQFIGNRKVVIDHWYAGNIGTYIPDISGKVSSESADILGIKIPINLRPFMMHKNAHHVTEQRFEKIINFQKLLG